MSKYRSIRGQRKKINDQYVPKMCALRKITYGEFSEFVQEKKVHITYFYTSSFVESSRKTDQGSGIMVFKMPQMGLLNFLIQTPPIKNDDNHAMRICYKFSW